MSMPKYIVKRSTFSCPLSPCIMWHHGLQYSECPIVLGERDMPECGRCKFKSKPKFRSIPKSKSYPKVERKKEAIPKIGKTYTSK